MPRVALRGPDIVVLDEVLPPAAFESVARDVDGREYHSVHSRGWDKAWRVWDGGPLRGDGVYFDPSGAFPWPGATYPTGTPIDAVVDAVRDAAAGFPEVAGSEGTDWVAVFLSPWLYPAGSALSLHRDGGRYRGSFTFFAHRRWRSHWGGELLAVQGDAGAPRGEPSWTAEDDGPTEPGSGIATCVFPWPNRLVLLGPDRPHMIGRVDGNAGAHVRASVAGFFLRPP